AAPAVPPTAPPMAAPTTCVSAWRNGSGRFSPAILFVDGGDQSRASRRTDRTCHAPTKQADGGVQSDAVFAAFVPLASFCFVLLLAQLGGFVVRELGAGLDRLL